MKTYRLQSGGPSGLRLSSGCNTCDSHQAHPALDSLVFFKAVSDWLPSKEFNRYIRSAVKSVKTNQAIEDKGQYKMLLSQIRSERQLLMKVSFQGILIDKLYAATSEQFNNLTEAWANGEESVFKVAGHRDKYQPEGSQYPNGSPGQQIRLQTVPLSTLKAGEAVTMWQAPRVKASAYGQPVQKAKDTLAETVGNSKQLARFRIGGKN